MDKDSKFESGAFRAPSVIVAVCGVFMAKGEGRLYPQGEHRTCNMCFDESATQSNNMPKLTFTIPMNRRLTRLRTAEPREVLGICTA
mgnify:CR=1 FL=1